MMVILAGINHSQRSEIRYVQVDKARQHELLDQLWLELLIALIGDQFGNDTDEICGAVCNIRQKGSKVESPLIQVIKCLTVVTSR